MAALSAIKAADAERPTSAGTSHSIIVIRIQQEGSPTPYSSRQAFAHSDRTKIVIEIEFASYAA
ncbi:MAG: hypothetical protein Tsb0032_10070 [Kiloniellaceae bacterium]